MEYKTDEKPDQDKCQNTPEEVCGTGLTQQPVGIIKDTCYEQDIDYIFKPE